MTSAAGWVEIDTGAVRHNLSVVRTHLAADVALCAVLKADAYGHGVDIVAPGIIAAGVTTIGVTANDEARAVRHAGHSGRIIRLRPAVEEEILDAADLEVEEWVGGLSHALHVQDAARRRGHRIAVHVSLNSTGLCRDGIPIDTSTGRAAVSRIAALDHLRIVGVCGHFPSDDVDDIRGGAAAFAADAATAVGLLGGDGIARHCATTHAALTVPESRFDMVRIGAALYGDTPLLDGALRPAMRVVSTIAALNEYAAGRTVGYDRAHVLAADARLAVIPIGYADGYRRGLGQRAEVLIGGRRARVVDRLAMNTLLVDVTALNGARIGDEVVLYGAQGADAITSAEIDRMTGQIAADLYVAWGRLLPRRAAGTPAAASLG